MGGWGIYFQALRMEGERLTNFDEFLLNST